MCLFFFSAQLVVDQSLENVDDSAKLLFKLWKISLKYDFAKDMSADLLDRLWYDWRIVLLSSAKPFVI